MQLSDPTTGDSQAALTFLWSGSLRTDEVKLLIRYVASLHCSHLKESVMQYCLPSNPSCLFWRSVGVRDSHNWPMPLSDRN